MDQEQEQYKSKDGKGSIVVEALHGKNLPRVKGVLAVMDGTGDTKFMWDAKNADETAAAKLQFDTLKAKGFIAFKVNKSGEKGEQIKEFDPEAEKIIMSPPLRGG